jgi:hypothetical protein
VSSVSIHPSQLVNSALRTLRRAGIDATLTDENARPAVAAATALLRALDIPAEVPPTAAIQRRIGTPTGQRLSLRLLPGTEAGPCPRQVCR